MLIYFVNQALGMITVGMSETTKYTRLAAVMIAAGIKTAKVGLRSTVRGQRGKW